jgi:single-strand DNA-binding protein
MGRLVAAPELRVTTTGKSVCSFRIAVDRNYTQGGERQADFLPCVAWNGTAEFVEKNFSKGNMIAVTGSIQTRTYEDKNGQKRTVSEISVKEVSFCGTRPAHTETPTETQYQSVEAAMPDFEEIGAEEGLPF